MKVIWLETLKDRYSLLIALLIVFMPLVVFIFVLVQSEREQTVATINADSSDTIADVEIMLDHVNGVLINLRTRYSVCNEEAQDTMHQLSFDVPGVVGLFVLDKAGNIECSNWLSDLTRFDFPLQFSHPGLHLSGEHYISRVAKSGILIYRHGRNNGAVAALVSSSYLRYYMSTNTPRNDALLLYNMDSQSQIAINGLVPPSTFNEIEQLVNSNSSEGEFGNRILHIKPSEQYANLIVAYSREPQSLSRILEKNVILLVLFFLVCISAMIGFLVYRTKKVTSYFYQLNQGLKADEFEPFFQPIVDMRTGRWVGAEALARWRRNNQDVAYPDEFIVAAENVSLIKTLTFQIADKVCKTAEPIVLNHADFYFSINLSPNHVDLESVANVDILQARYRSLSPKNIYFEITERGLVDAHRDEFREAIDNLTKQGYRFGLDDFGTGQSGLEYFSNIEPHFLKIDRRFVSAIGTPNHVDFQLLKTIVQLAKSLDLKIVAEGVESEIQKAWLLEQDIFLAQGWLYSKALPDSEFVTELNKNLLNNQSRN